MRDWVTGEGWEWGEWEERRGARTEGRRGMFQWFQWFQWFESTVQGESTVLGGGEEEVVGEDFTGEADSRIVDN